MVNRSVSTSVNHRLYPEVLQNGRKSASVTSCDNHPIVHSWIRGNSTLSPCIVDNHTDCIPPKWIRVKHNVSSPASNQIRLVFKHNHIVKGEPYMQESSIAIHNRYQVLKSIEDIANQRHLSDQHGNTLEVQLEGNENETGKKLGQKPCHNTTISVENLTFFKGNKNKTGKKLGIATQNLADKCSTGQNKHYIGAIKTYLGLNWVICLTRVLIPLKKLNGIKNRMLC